MIVTKMRIVQIYRAIMSVVVIVVMRTYHFKHIFLLYTFYVKDSIIIYLGVFHLVIENSK